ncbi:N-acetyltransferase [Candidatus Daviesbacteria bacterium]|nr:N-acetyltransferase [Candidatus Daviesbacteria bacterium]
MQTKIKIYSNVDLGEDSRVDMGVVIGFSENEKAEKTTIGKKAILRANTFIYAGVEIGDNFQTGPNVLVREDNVIGDNVAIWHGATISPGNVIGDGCRIHAGSFLELVTLGKRVFIGPGVVFTDDPHPVNPSPRKHFGGATVDDEVVIGGHVTILPHVRIGKHAIIGAGSVVTKDVPAGEVWVGNPAKFLKLAQEISCNIGKGKHFPYQEFWKIK